MLPHPTPLRRGLPPSPSTPATAASTAARTAVCAGASPHRRRSAATQSTPSSSSSARSHTAIRRRDLKERNGGEKRQISKRPFSNQSRLLQSIHPMPPTAMASTSLFLPTAAGASTARRRPFSSLRTPYQVPTARLHRAPRLAVVSAAASPASPASSSLDALIFDCDGVILESENLHRQAYNDAFAHFGVRCPPASADTLYWDEAFYDELQNRIGGGKPKMRWYFGENGWPSSKIFETPPSADSDKEKLIDIIQDWKTERYKEIIKSGTVEPRPGVLQLMDEVKGYQACCLLCSN
ncbi:haloacid dehalogenase-like hydrolase domain-containing protein At4g39970 isoform X2 [Panicum virgatum]|uniref:haloacid dehalogenase-like hydrolase domain-containing protein At4g39970 isoform X2 n=1 Tax=Panicum virgatum TaxID=38727 RepID=UPI0019D4F079|nr:haloacid dehalogenase-like hydrolase domain-containing protein At4g39970 isoform X2 [Panicum virgatum]